MKKIVYIGPFHMPDHNAAAHRVLSNAKLLKELNYECIFIGCNPDANDCFSHTYFKYAGFRIFEIKCQSSVEKIKKFSNMEYLEFIFEKYDDIVAVIAYDCYALTLFKLKCLCKKKKLPLIADTDEWFGLVGNNIVEKSIRFIDSEVRMRIIQPKLNGIITISSFLANYYKNKLPTLQIPPLVDKMEKKWQPHQPLVETTKLNLIYSGSPGLKKDNLQVIIKILCSHTFQFKVNLLIVGITKETFLTQHPEYQGKIQNQFNEIVFLGRKSHTEALSLLKEADFSLFLRDVNRTSSAGFPTKFVESISAGIPVITNQTSNIADYLQNDKNGYLLDNSNIEEEIVSIFNKPLSELKKIKNNVNADLFDYRAFKAEMVKIIDIIETYPY